MSSSENCLLLPFFFSLPLTPNPSAEEMPYLASSKANGFCASYDGTCLLPYRKAISQSEKKCRSGPGWGRSIAIVCRGKQCLQVHGWGKKPSSSLFIVTLHPPFFLLVFLVPQLPEVAYLKVCSNFLGWCVWINWFLLLLASSVAPFM